MRMLPHGIAILLCLGAIYCAHDSGTLLRTLASIPDVDPTAFLKSLLAMRRANGFDDKNSISQLVLSRSDIPDDIYKALVEVLSETRKELRAGDSSLTTLNALIWLNSHDGQTEILDLTDALLKTVHNPKLAAFSIKDLARDMAMARLPRQRNPTRVAERAKRSIQQENLTDVLFDLKSELQLEIAPEAINDLSELERNVINDKIRNLFVHFLNKLHLEMTNQSVPILEAFYENSETMLRESGFALLSNGLERKYNWRDAQRAHVREIFVKAVHMIHQKEHLASPIPEDLAVVISEQQFLSAIRQIVPQNLTSLTDEQVFGTVFIAAGNLIALLRKATTLEHTELIKEAEQNLTVLRNNYAKMLHDPKYQQTFNPHSGLPVVQIEELAELARMGLEEIVEGVRDRYQRTKSSEPSPIAPEVMEFIREWYQRNGLESSYNEQIAAEIAWTREKLGDYKFQLLTAEFFEKHMVWKTSRLESEDWMTILRLSNGEDLVDVLKELRTLLVELLNLRPDDYNFIDTFELTEVDRDETVRLVKAFEGLVEPTKRSESIAALLYDVSTAQSKEDFMRILHVHTVYHLWDPEVLNAGLEKVEAMKKTVKNPRKFTEFIRNVATLVATKKIGKEHLYYLLDHITKSKTSLELQNTLVSLARLLIVFDTKTVMDGQQRPSEDPEVLAAYEVLTRNGGVNMEFVRSYMKKYEQEPEQVKVVLKDLGVDPESIRKHNEITAGMDVLIELLEAARTYPNLQRLLAVGKEMPESEIQKTLDTKDSGEDVEDVTPVSTSAATVEVTEPPAPSTPEETTEEVTPEAVPPIPEDPQQDDEVEPEILREKRDSKYEHKPFQKPEERNLEPENDHQSHFKYEHKLAAHQNSRYDHKLADIQQEQQLPLQKPDHHHFHINGEPKQRKEHKIYKAKNSNSIQWTGLSHPTRPVF